MRMTGRLAVAESGGGGSSDPPGVSGRHSTGRAPEAGAADPNPESPGSPRVVIADDHPFFRTSLARLLSENGIEVAAEAAGGEAAIDAVRETSPDVAVMDLKMPGVSGLDATRRLSSAYPATRVVVLSVSASEDDLVDAVLAGASGYVLKDAPPDELTGAIRAAAAGDPLVSPRLATALLRRIVDAICAGEGLVGVGVSDRELQILDLLGNGKPAAEIAAELDIEANDVHAYTSSLLTKLRVDTAVRTALRNMGPLGP